MNGSPVYWNSPTYGPAIYLWAAGDPLKVFRLVGGLFQTPASAQGTALAPGGMPGGMLSLSANGSAAGTGILWAALSRGGDANHTPQPGILRAYDASNVTRELWNSQQNATRDTLGNFSKFSPPTVANGKVFVAEPVEQAGRLRPDWPVRRQHRAGRQRRRGSEPRGARHRDADGHRHRRWQPDPARPAHDDVEPGERSRAVTFGAPNALSTTASFTVPGVYTIRLSAFDGEATTSDDVVVTVDPPAGSGTGLLAQYFNDAGSGIYFTALVLTRTDPTVDFDWADASPRSAGAGRQLLGSMERTGDGAGHRQLHVHHHVRRWRASLCERSAADRQLDGPSGRAEQRDASRWRRVRGTTSGWTTTTTRRWRRPGCRGRTPARARRSCRSGCCTRRFPSISLPP